jgi:translation initiation factor IF-1
MKLSKINEMTGGWFVGNFEPSILKTSQFEACVKQYSQGDREPSHFQKSAVEVTVIISGQARMGDVVLNPGDIILLEPYEIADFEALTEVTLVALKTPSIPEDKVLAND